MPDQIKLITRRITTMTYQAIDRKAQFIWGTVLSRNPDGTLNVDDGRGGCVLIVPPSNARTGDRISVDLGALIGGVGMPGVATYTAGVPQVNHAKPAVFIDNVGRVYSDAGAFISTGGTPTADVDASFGYSHDGGTPIHEFVGSSPGYNDLEIGIDGVSGYEGSRFSTNNTVLSAGLGSSSGTYCGIEHTESGGTSVRWFINIRDSAFALVASDAANYIHNWMTAHPNTFHLDTYGTDDSYDAHISPDPEDGSFWVNLVGGPGWADPDPGDPAPVFNVKAADGSLVRTVQLAASGLTSSFRRVHRIIPA